MTQNMTLNSISEIVNLGSDNPAEVALVIDVSGSMKGDKILTTKAAASKFIKLMRVNKDSLGICSFNTLGKVEWGADQKVNLLANGGVQASAIGAVHGLAAGGGTDMHAGLDRASKMFTGFDASNKAVILLSDGQDSSTEAEKKLSQELNAAGKEVYTIAIGKDADHELLKSLAGDDDRYNAVPDAFTMNEVFD